MGAPLDRALLLARTTRNLRPSQVAHRARLRAQRWPPGRPVGSSVLGALPARHRPVVGWPAPFRAIDLEVGEAFPSPEENSEGRFTFLGDPRRLGRGGWEAPGASRLWNYHLQYMEWAWSFASHPDRAWARAAFADLWRSWEPSAPFGRGDAWSPYVASLRAWALCGTYDALVAGSAVQPAVDASLARHARFLRWHMEHDVGGNHLLKNLKGLVGLGVFFDDDRLLGMAAEEVARQVRIQVLDDGGHYERSPSYHCQVLGDLIDIDGLLAAAGRPPLPGLGGAIDAMRRWLGIMRMPDGDVPLFNDCVLVGPARLAALQPGPAVVDRLTVLPVSGYVVIRPDEAVHLIADVGDPCPPDLPAHAHADTLSFELALDGERAVVDSGTSTYEPGPQRAHERSTVAHNTVSVDGIDQTEVWGTFRAARLARARLERADDDGVTVTVVASHDGYRRLPGRPGHRRTWDVTRTLVSVTDEVSGQGVHEVAARVHLAAGAEPQLVWTAPSAVQVTDGPSTLATGFGRTAAGRVVSAAWRGALPVTLRMELRPRAGVLQGSETSIENGEPRKGTT